MNRIGYFVSCLCDEHTRTPHHSACDGTSDDLQGSRCSTKMTFERHLIRKNREKGTNWFWQFVEFVTVTHFLDNINAGIKVTKRVPAKILEGIPICTSHSTTWIWSCLQLQMKFWCQPRPRLLSPYWMSYITQECFLQLCKHCYN